MSHGTLLWRNLWRRKLRTLLTIASILIAFLIFGTVRAFEAALNSGVDLAAADRLVVINKINFTQPMPYAYLAKIASVEGVKRVTFANWFGAYWQEPQNVFAAFAVDPETWLDSYPEHLIDADDRARFLANRSGAIVGRSLATRFGIEEGDHIPLPSSIFSKTDGSRVWDVTVEAIAEPRDEQTDTTYLLFHYDYLNESRSFGKDSIGWFVVTTESQQLNEQVADAIDAMFFNSANQTKTDTEKAFSAAFIKQIGNIGLIVVSVVGAAFFTILVIAANTMVLAIRERTGEIAVMKTLGFTGGRIFGLVLGESLLVVLLGGLPGIALAVLMAKGASAAMAGFLPPLIVGGAIVGEALVVMLLLGLLVGAIPATRAFRLEIASGLGRG